MSVKDLLRVAARHLSPAVQKAFVGWMLWRFGDGLTQKEAAQLAGCSLAYLVALAGLDDNERFRVARGVSILGRVRRQRVKASPETLLDRLVQTDPDAVLAALDRITAPDR